MKKFGLTFLFCITLVSILPAQKNTTTTATPVPVDPITKLITYEGVVDVKGASANTLYTRALDWFNTHYKNPSDVIRENDADGAKIVGKARFKITNPPDKSGTRGDAGLVQYTITLAARDGRYKYEIQEISWKQLSVYPCERWLDKTAAGYLPVYNEYLIQVDKEMMDLIASFKDHLSHEKPVKDKDNW
jgi:hypothetical protein